MKTRFFLSAAFLLSVIGFSLQADPASSVHETITSISITGLKRTKPHVAEEALNRFIGMNADSVNLNDAQAAVLATGILDVRDIGIKDNPKDPGKILWVEVQEKWAILPFPMVSADSGNVSFGLMLMDNNAFGLNDKFILGGIYGSAGWAASVMYMHSAKKSRPGWNTSFSYIRSNHETRNQDNDVLRDYDLYTLSANTGINFNISEALSARAGAEFTWSELHTSDSSFAVPEDDGMFISLSSGLNLRRNSWDGYFLAQKAISGSFSYSFGIEAPSYYTIHINGIYEQPIFAGLKGLAKASFIYAPEVIPLFESSPQMAGIDILPSSFRAKNYLGGSVGLEKSLFRFQAGTLSLMASYQAVFSEGPLIDDSFDHGVAGALCFYMKKIAMPAVGLGASYNAAASYFKLYFNVGMSF